MKLGAAFYSSRIKERVKLVVFSIRRATEDKQKAVNAQEVFSLWDLLKTKYYELETINLYKNFVHDPEFNLYLRSRYENVIKEVKDMEKIVKEYAIAAPSPPRKDVHSSVNTEVMTDAYMGASLVLLYQELIEMSLRAFRTSATNDKLRKVFKNYTFNAIGSFDMLIKYIKLKGWLDIPAPYPNLPAKTKELLDCGEAFHLWDHLTFRYLNIELTQIYFVLAKDGDFKAMLKKGIQDVLQKDAERLEKELSYFGIPFPEAPKTIYDNLGTIEIPDKAMFKQLLSGMASATVLHAQAIKQATTNDRIRKLFNELLIAEIDVIDNVILYGKAKGWMDTPPRFSAIQ